ncbi:hypothetical protein DVH05_009197 [Phytophthora capsici]|nr:hypothetical protein DVH05_009197 [Phytophthora capsici]
MTRTTATNYLTAGSTVVSTTERQELLYAYTAVPSQSIDQFQDRNEFSVLPDTLDGLPALGRGDGHTDCVGLCSGFWTG